MNVRGDWSSILRRTLARLQYKKRKYDKYIREDSESYESSGTYPHFRDEESFDEAKDMCGQLLEEITVLKGTIRMMEKKEEEYRKEKQGNVVLERKNA